MPPLAASLVLAHEHRVWHECETRRTNTADLLHIFDASEAFEKLNAIPVPHDGQGGCLRLPLLAPRGMRGFEKPDLAQRLGVMPGYPRPLPELPAARERALEGPPTPGATRLVEELITVPTHGLLTLQDKTRVVQALADYDRG